MQCLIPIIAVLLTAWILRTAFVRRAARQVKGIFPQKISPYDPRPPVLYLRAFQEDDSTDTTPLGTRYESLLVSVLEQAGNVVAIGRPGEAEAPDGATRIYVGDKDWKEEVVALIKKAQIVVFQAHVIVPEKQSVTQSPRISEGLFWEFQTLVTQVKPEQLLLSLPVKFRNRSWFGEDPDRLENYSFFRSEIEALLPVSLPATIGRGAFVIFDSAWQPTILYRPSAWMLFFGQGPGTRVGMRETLRPFFRRQGIKLSYRRTILVGLLCVSIIFGPTVLFLLFLVVAAILDSTYFHPYTR